MRSPRVVHTVASTRASHGGTSRSVPNLCEALAETGLEVALVTRVRPGEVEHGVALLPSEPVKTELVSEPTGLRGWVQGERAFRLAVMRQIGSENRTIVHDHGAWLPTNRAALRAAEKTGATLVVSPRGMLTRWSLSHNRLRKRVAWALFQRQVLERATLIHATSEDEAEELADLGLSRPVAIIPNAIDPPDNLSNRACEDADKRTALFLSRFHPKKGLPNLIRAWARVQPTDWKLLLVGPSEGGHREHMEELSKDLGVHSSVHFQGAVDDEEKWRLYQSADVFVLPSHSENFGIVVGEALASGVPVITTKATPWQELDEFDCGWWIDLGIEPLKQAIEEATKISVDRRIAMGKRGKKLIMERYSRTAIGIRMRMVYEWLMGGGTPPKWVRVICD